MPSTLKLISKKLNLDQQQTEGFIKRVRQQAGYPVKYKDILKALNKVKSQNDLVLETVNYLKGYHQVSPLLGHKLGLTTRGINRLHQKIGEELGYSLREGEILSDLDEIRQSRRFVTPRKKIVLKALNEVKAEDLTESWNFQSHELALILPNYDEDEKWIGNEDIVNTVARFSDCNCVPKVEELLELSRQCWAEIMDERRYQVPSLGRAELMASDRLAEVLRLKSIRFLQEGLKAPQVFLRFDFGTPSKVGILRVNTDGNTVGFHTKIDLDVFKILVEAITFTYYRDLVVPSGVYYYSSKNRSRQFRKTRSPRTHNSRRLPRPRKIHVVENPYNIDDWYSAQERERHNVVGHIRWVDDYFVASQEKQQQAEAAGVRLPNGYTWVLEHERGEVTSRGLKLLGTDLVEHTLFLAPKRASKDLNKLL